MSSRLGTMMYGELDEVSNLLDTCNDAGEVAGALMNAIRHIRGLESKVQKLEKRLAELESESFVKSAIS